MKMPEMKIWDEKADEIDDDKFYFHLLIFRPQISHIFQNSMLFFRISLWIEDVALGRDFDFFFPDRIVVLVVRQVKKTKSQWPEEEVFFNNTKGTTNNPASIFHLLLLDINKGKKYFLGDTFQPPCPFLLGNRARVVCVLKNSR